MTTGQMIMYGGIALFALSLIGEIVSTILGKDSNLFAQGENAEENI